MAPPTSPEAQAKGLLDLRREAETDPRTRRHIDDLVNDPNRRADESIKRLLTMPLTDLEGIATGRPMTDTPNKPKKLMPQGEGDNLVWRPEDLEGALFEGVKKMSEPAPAATPPQDVAAAPAAVPAAPASAPSLGSTGSDPTTPPLDQPTVPEAEGATPQPPAFNPNTDIPARGLGQAVDPGTPAAVEAAPVVEGGEPPSTEAPQPPSFDFGEPPQFKDAEELVGSQEYQAVMQQATKQMSPGQLFSLAAIMAKSPQAGVALLSQHERGRSDAQRTLTGLSASANTFNRSMQAQHQMNERQVMREEQRWAQQVSSFNSKRIIAGRAAATEAGVSIPEVPVTSYGPESTEAINKWEVELGENLAEQARVDEVMGEYIPQLMQMAKEGASPEQIKAQWGTILDLQHTRSGGGRLFGEQHQKDLWTEYGMGLTQIAVEQEKIREQESATRETTIRRLENQQIDAKLENLRKARKDADTSYVARTRNMLRYAADLRASNEDMMLLIGETTSTRNYYANDSTNPYFVGANKLLNGDPEAVPGSLAAQGLLSYQAGITKELVEVDMHVSEALGGELPGIQVTQTLQNAFGALQEGLADSGELEQVMMEFAGGGTDVLSIQEGLHTWAAGKIIEYQTALETWNGTDPKPVVHPLADQYALATGAVLAAFPEIAAHQFDYLAATAESRRWQAQRAEDRARRAAALQQTLQPQQQGAQP